MPSNFPHDSRALFGFPERLDELPMADANRAGAPKVAFVDLHSQTPLPDLPEAAGGVAPRPPQPNSAAHATRVGETGRVWLNGDVLMCACPDCAAPMSIRLWLMVADCWLCGTSIELDEEMEREARQLLAERNAGEVPQEPSPVPAANGPTQGQGERRSPAATSEESPPQPEPQGERPPEPRRTEVKPTPPARGPRETTIANPAFEQQPRRRTAAETLAQRRLRENAAEGTFSRRLRRAFDDTPAWLVSVIFHLILLTLLGLLYLPYERDDLILTLSPVVNPARQEGGVVIEEQIAEGDFDLPLPTGADLSVNGQREALFRADQDARELRIDPETVDAQMADLREVKRAISGTGGLSGTFAARDPRIRVEMVKKEGGTTLTEAAVARALRWLAKKQQRDGRWSLDGGTRSDSAATSLALMPFLGAGQTHLVGRYQNTVSGGLKWLVENQKSDGDMRTNSSGNAGMYAHGQSAIVLCEAFMLTGDEKLREPAQKAIDFIVKAQYRDGGWRYAPYREDSRARGDTSVVGWQLMALQSARAAKLEVPSTTFERAGQFLDTVQSHDGSRYAYTRGQGPTHVMTAEGLLCRMYMGWTLNDPQIRQGIRWLSAEHLPNRSLNIYYCYYATQAFHHFGGSEWKRWNGAMRDALVHSQVKTGRDAGSWQHAGGHDRAGGRIYATALSACTLEVYYRHLPIFRQIDLE